MDEINTAIALDSTNSTYYYFRATAYAVLENDEAAISDLEHAFDLGLPPEFEGQAQELLAILQE